MTAQIPYLCFHSCTTYYMLFRQWQVVPYICSPPPPPHVPGGSHLLISASGEPFLNVVGLLFLGGLQGGTFPADNIYGPSCQGVQIWRVATQRTPSDSQSHQQSANLPPNMASIHLCQFARCFHIYRARKCEENCSLG